MATTLKISDPAKAREYFENKLDFTTGPVEISEKIKGGHNHDFAIIDVRAEKDYRAGHIPGSVNLPKEKWSSFEGLEKNKVNVLVCYSQTCHLAARAAVEFASQNYPVMEMDGGFEAWKDSELEIEK